MPRVVLSAAGVLALTPLADLVATVLPSTGEPSRAIMTRGLLALAAAGFRPLARITAVKADP
jgi:hypothetical protein